MRFSRTKWRGILRGNNQSFIFARQLKPSTLLIADGFSLKGTPLDFTDFFNDFKDIGRIDWRLMRAKYWFDSDMYPDRSRRRQAEFLVYQFLPWNLVTNIVVYDAANAKVVSDILGEQSPAVDVKRGWYY